MSGKRQLSATNKVDHISSKVADNEKIPRGKMHPSGRFHAETRGSHLRRVNNSATKSNVNLFTPPPTPSIVRTRSSVQNFVQAASATSNSQNLGRKTVGSAGRSTIDFKTMFEPTTFSKPAVPRQNTTSSFLAHHSEPVEVLRRPSPRAPSPSSYRVTNPSLQQEAKRATSPQVSRTYQSSVGNVMNGTATEKKDRPHLRRPHPSIFDVPKQEKRTVVATPRHPITTPLQSRIFGCGSGQCTDDFKPSSWLLASPAKCSMQHRSRSPITGVSPGINAPESAVRVSRRASTPPPKPPQDMERRGSGRKSCGRNRNETTFSF